MVFHQSNYLITFCDYLFIILFIMNSYFTIFNFFHLCYTHFILSLPVCFSNYILWLYESHTFFTLIQKWTKGTQACGICCPQCSVFNLFSVVLILLFYLQYII